MKDAKKKNDPVTEDTEPQNKEETAVNEPEAEAEQSTPPTDEWHDRFVRLAADFDNYKKRSKAEKDGIYATATADAAAELLPVIDNLERALSAAEDSPLKSGVEMVLTQASKAFESLGISPVGAEGEVFDPNLHNAVMHVEDEALGENVIVQVLQRGYRLGDKVIRHALVKVAN